MVLGMMHLKLFHHKLVIDLVKVYLDLELKISLLCMKIMEDISILGKVSTDGLDDTTVTAKA